MAWDFSHTTAIQLGITSVGVVMFRLRIFTYLCLAFVASLASCGIVPDSGSWNGLSTQTVYFVASDAQVLTGTGAGQADVQDAVQALLQDRAYFFGLYAKSGESFARNTRIHAGVSDTAQPNPEIEAPLSYMFVSSTVAGTTNVSGDTVSAEFTLPTAAGGLVLTLSFNRTAAHRAADELFDQQEFVPRSIGQFDAECTLTGPVAGVDVALQFKQSMHAENYFYNAG